MDTKVSFGGSLEVLAEYVSISFDIESIYFASNLSINVKK